MEIWVVVLVLVVVVLLLWKPPRTDYEMAVTRQAISPDIIGVIIENVQKNNPDIVPIETLFVNKTGDGVYSGRFMFFNTRGYYGVQYDVQASITGDGQVIITNMSSTSQVDKFDSGFSAFKKDSYRSYNDVTASLEAQLASLRPTQ